MALRTRQPFQMPQEAVQPASTCGAAIAVALRTLRRAMMLVNCILLRIESWICLKVLDFEVCSIVGW